mmetsp:Transcript_7737/g.14444  ORF Transcript_7737/g.14444 Transcript_7737/m.14444 type:complete len:258 (-) Transcript_7737:1436-2209(-)
MLLVLSNKLVETHGVVDTRAHILSVVAASQGDCWHAHPKSLAGCGGSGVRERVQGNIHLAIKGEVTSVVLDQWNQVNSVCNAVGLKQRHDPIPSRLVVHSLCFHQQPALGLRVLQNERPEFHHLVRDLRKSIESAESEDAGVNDGRGLNLRGVASWSVTKKASWKTLQSLHIPLASVLRVGYKVCDPVVHFLQTCGVWVSNPRRLNRSRAHRHSRKAIVRRVARQFDQNVNFVLSNQSRQVQLREVHDIPPQHILAR